MSLHKTKYNRRPEAFVYLPGTFVVIEGMDCTGKSTLCEKLRKTHFPEAVFTREPSDRDILKEPADWKFLADRYTHLGRVVLPALAQGKLVISDRYHQSAAIFNTVYGDYRLHAGVLEPDLVFIVEENYQTVAARHRERGEDIPTPGHFASKAYRYSKLGIPVTSYDDRAIADTIIEYCAGKLVRRQELE